MSSSRCGDVTQARGDEQENAAVASNLYRALGSSEAPRATSAADRRRPSACIVHSKLGGACTHAGEGSSYSAHCGLAGVSGR